MRTLVTGGSGFIGRSLIDGLLARGVDVRATCREMKPSFCRHARLEWVEVGSIGARTNWMNALRDVDQVVHLAARAHVLQESESESEAEAAFFKTNYLGTMRLADECRGRVRRFVYLSSIGVHGSASPQEALTEYSAIAPDAAYGRSKAKAESYLQTLVARGELNCTILRPPLVYGPNAPGNLARLVRSVERGMPLPLGSVDNRRNLIGVYHLVHVIIAILDAESVKRTAYVVADREVVSTAEIIRSIAKGLDCSPKLWPVPVGILRAAGAIAARRYMVEQLVGNLEVDASNFRDEFGDLQQRSTRDGLGDMARTLRR